MNEYELIVINLVKKKYSSLSSAEKKVADYVISNPLQIIEESAEAIAISAKTSAATVIRFCRACGFSGLSDLRFRIQQEQNVIKSNSNITEITTRDSVSNIKQKIIVHHEKILDAFMADSNSDAYIAAADALLNAKRILIIGDSRHHPAAVCFRQICALLDLRCDTAIDTLYEGIQAKYMEAGDVVIGFCYSGRMKGTVESFKLFKEANITTICVVSTSDSEMFDNVDIILNTNSVNNLSHFSSLNTTIAQIIVLEILYAVMATRLGIETAVEVPQIESLII